MERIINCLEEVVARRGFEGIRLKDLWTEIESRTSCKMGPVVQNYLWRHMMACAKLSDESASKLSFFWTPENPQRKLPPLTEGIGARDPARVAVVAGELDKPREACEAVKDGMYLFVVASERRRMRDIGLRDPNHGFTPMMYAVLEAVNSCGEMGISQVEVAARMGTDSKSVSHYARELIRTNFITKRQFVLFKENGRRAAAVHLVMVKWANMEGNFEVAEVENDDGGDNDDDEAATNVGRTIIYAELAMAVLQKLNAAKSQMLFGRDIAAYLSNLTGFRRGSWFSVRKRLLKAQYISIGKADKDDDSTLTHMRAGLMIIKLLRMPKSMYELEQNLASSSTSVTYLPLYQEFPIEYQIYRHIQNAGSTGILQSDIRIPGLGQKLINKRIDRLLQARQNVLGTQDSVGKIRTKRLKAAKEGRTAFEEQALSETVIVKHTPTSKRKSIALASTSSVAEVKDSEKPENFGKHLSTLVNTKLIRRRQLILDTLEEKKVLPRIGTRYLINSLERTLGENCDSKTSKKLVDDIIAEGYAYLVTTMVTNERGVQKPVELVLHPSVQDASLWKPIVQSMSMDDLLCRYLLRRMGPKPYSDAERFRIDSIQLLDADGNMANPDGSIRLISEDEESSSDEENADDEEEIEFMDSDEEKAEISRREAAKARRVKARKEAAKRRAKKNANEGDGEMETDSNQNTENNENSENPNASNKMEMRNYFQKLMWGMERAILQRTNVLHAWLCYHHFGEDALGPLLSLLPNDIASVVNANNLQRQQEMLHKQLVQGTGPNASPAPPSSPAPSSSRNSSAPQVSKGNGSILAQETTTEENNGNAGNDASSALVSDPAIPNPSVLMSALFGKRPGHSTNSHEPTPKTHAHSASSDTSYPVRRRRNADNMSLHATMAEDAQISWEKANQRWFDGPEVHLESLLPEMPLYVFMKTVGIIEPPPGVVSPTQASNTLVKDLPQSAQAVLLSRRNHQLPLHRLVECMKKLNLLQPKITISDEDTPVTTGPVVPKYILNPIGIVWRNQIPADYEKGQATALPQKYFLYQFDAKKSPNSDASVTNYWWRLKRESIAFLKEIIATQESIAHFNTPPPGRNFPKSPGLPDMCISSVSWSGRSEGLNNKILKANYDQLKLELDRATNLGSLAKPESSPLLLTLSAQLDLTPNAILRWLEQRTLQLEKRERESEKKRKNVSHDTLGEPARKKPLRRNNIEEDDEDTAYTSRTITKPATKKIQIQVPLAVTPLTSAAAPTASSSDSIQQRPGARGAAMFTSEEPPPVPGKRWTQRQLAKLVDMFVMQKARAGIYLDDISTLYDGVDKDALSQHFHRRWEVLEGYISESVSTVETLFDMSTRIAKAMRQLEEDGETIGLPPSTSTQAPTSDNAMEVDNGPPAFVIELPASIEQFRAQNAIIYSNSSEYVVPRLSRRQMDVHTSDAGAEEGTEEQVVTEEQHSLPDTSAGLGFSESTRKLFSVLPASEEHAIRLAESGFYHRGTGISTVAVCPSAPPSVWMLPNPRYAVLADHIKSWLMQDSMSEMLMPIVQRLLGDCPQKVYDEAFQALQQRRVVTASVTSGRRAHLSAQWLLWLRPVDAALEFGNSAQTEKSRFADEKVGYPANPTLPTSDSALFQPWILNFDIFSPPATIATILNGMESQSLYVDLQVTSVTQKYRKTRKPIIVPTTLGKRRKEAQAKRNANMMEVTSDAPAAGATPSNKSAQNNPEIDDIDLLVRWWREPSIMSRYTSPSMDALASQYHHAVSEPAEMKSPEDSSYEKVIHLDCVQQKENDERNILVELLQLRGFDDEYIQLCQSTLDVIRAADAKAIELPQLEQALVEQSLIEGYSGLPITGIASYEGHLALIEILDTLVMHRLVHRVLGEMDEAWVATEFSQCWTVPLSASITETTPTVEAKETVVYFPWTRLDGSTDKILLRRLRAHVALMVIESPGISEELILDQFEVFRPSVGREMINLLLTDDLVKESYKRFETPSFITASAESVATPTEVKVSNESEYHLYLRWKQRFILGEGPAPTFTVSRDFWPNKDIQLRL